MAATDWIKVRTNLWDDPRIGALCDKAGVGEATVVGGLYWLWATADSHSAKGELPGMTLKTVDRKTGIPGFGEALVGIGWLYADSTGLTILKFEEHNGASAKKRAEDAKRKALAYKAVGETAQLFPETSEISPGKSGEKADEKSGKSELEEDKNKKKSKPKPSSPSAQKVSAEQKELEALGVDPQHAADWLKARKAKNLVATTTAFEQAASEAAKLGWTFPEAIAYAAGKGWGGFMAKWVENDGDTGHYGPRNGVVQSQPAQQSQPRTKAQARHDGLDAAAAEFAARIAAKDGGVPGPASQDPAAYVPPDDGMTFDME
jgi:hypothetical protein